MNVNSESTVPVKDPNLKEFIAFCRQELGYKKPAKVVISDDHSKAVEMKSMAAYFPNPEDNFIWVLRGRRQRADWYRSLAHELVHHAQRERGDSLDGADGSDCENEANGKAGALLREWGRRHPEIFEDPSNLALNERVLAVTEEDIQVQIEIDSTSHADDRTDRHVGSKITDKQIVEVAKLGFKQIGHDQLVGIDSIGQKYCIYDSLSNLNVVGTLLRQKGQLVFLVITVMVTPEFKMDPSTKKVIV